LLLEAAEAEKVAAAAAAEKAAKVEEQERVRAAAKAEAEAEDVQRAAEKVLTNAVIYTWNTRGGIIAHRNSFHASGPEHASGTGGQG